MTTLTAIGVERLQKQLKRYDVADAKLPGLRVTVLPSGVKSWSLRYSITGRERRLVIGRFPTVGVAQAREIASAALREVAAGVDPQAVKIEKRHKAKAGIDDEMLFQKGWELYRDNRVKKTMKESTADRLVSVFESMILPKLARRRLKDVREHDIVGLCDEQEKRGAPSQANKVFVELRRFFNWLRERRMIAFNPCDGLKAPKGSAPRQRVLTDQELVWFWRACGELEYPFGPLYRLLLVTGSRRSEMSKLVESEIARKENTITLPEKRTKNKLEHVIHLAPLAREILEAGGLRNKHGWIFTTTGETPVSGFSRSKKILDAKMADYAKEVGATIQPWVIHDLRRTVATGMAGLDIALPVIERCLNHVSGSFAGIVGVYNKQKFLKQQHAAFEAWDAYVSHLIGRTSQPE